MVRHVGDFNEIDAILWQFVDCARDGSEEESALGDLNAIVADVCRRYIEMGNAVALRLGRLPRIRFRGLALRRGGKEIQVETENLCSQAAVTVLDNGPGIRSGSPRISSSPSPARTRRRHSHAQV